MSKKQDLLTRLGAEIAEFVISNRGKEPGEYAEKLRQLQMIHNAVEYDPKLTPAQVEFLYDKGVTLEDISVKMGEYHLDKDTISSFFHGVEWYADRLYSDHRLTVLYDRLKEENDIFLEGIRALPVDKIIEKAGQIAEYANILEVISQLNHNDLESQQVDALLTIEHPLKELSEGWPTYDSEDVSNFLSDLAYDQQGELREERGVPTERADILEYRKNYLAYKDKVQENPYAERIEALKSKMEADYASIKRVCATAKAIQLVEEARAAYYLYSPTPVEVEVLLTYTHPLKEIINHAVQHSTDISCALTSVISAREAELTGYLMRMDEMPEFLQGPLKEFSQRCEAGQAYYPQGAPEESTGYEPGQE